MAVVSDYTNLFLQLLPVGDAWQFEEGDDLHKIAAACAPEFARIQDYCDGLIAESDPETTAYLIDDWEKDWGLPNTVCSSQIPTTLEERQQVLDIKYTTLGGQSRQHILNIMSKYGYNDVSIIEYAPGQQVTGWDGLIAPDDSAYIVQVDIADVYLATFFRVGASTVGQPLISLDSIHTDDFLLADEQCDQPLQQWFIPENAVCEITKQLHAHKRLLITYNAREFYNV